MQFDLEIGETGRYGKSIFALRNFKKGEIVFVVQGPITTTPTIYTIPIDWGKLVDDQGLGKNLCHSCDPNCGIRNKVGIAAMRDIARNEEITIDYAMIVPEYGDEISEPQLVCKCGSSICRGRFGSYKRLPPELKKKYSGYISEYLTKENN